MSASSQVDPHDKMRARDVNKAAKGEQAPRPALEYGTVSSPPSIGPTFSVCPLHKLSQRMNYTTHSQTEPASHCYARYIENIRCRHDRGKKSCECEMFAKQYLGPCPIEWIERWKGEG
ncbi:putative cytochrome c oxidase subunit 6b-like [Tripterygium wilfordii]|uniref:putative cytochrome c oxidase subunit 6b-like n=1 Tax=Tripterygium wilfordii TaxID=458696 RepID=UPI0018F84B39|nr:putative cytochrome c oxidase subunit 6b-like [Tripterygium wilfordii]